MTSLESRHLNSRAHGDDGEAFSPLRVFARSHLSPLDPLLCLGVRKRRASVSAAGLDSQICS